MDYSGTAPELSTQPELIFSGGKLTFFHCQGVVLPFRSTAIAMVVDHLYVTHWPQK